MQNFVLPCFASLVDIMPGAQVHRGTNWAEVPSSKWGLFYTLYSKKGLPWLKSNTIVRKSRPRFIRCGYGYQLSYEATSRGRIDVSLYFEELCIEMNLLLVAQ